MKDRVDKIKTILEYYVLTNKLKDTVRSGWKYWNVETKRLESVAEHIYGTCMLAVAIWSETLPVVNLPEVLMTLAIHETEEVIIGDLTPFDKDYEQKQKKGREAVQSIFANMVAKDVFETLIENFDNKSTPEAIFAYKCDKLECDLQAKIYDEKGLVNPEKADKKILEDKRIKAMKEKGVTKMSSFFNYNDRTNIQKYSYDGESDIFLDIMKYIEKNSILNIKFTEKQQEEKKTQVKQVKKQENATVKKNNV